MMDTLCSMLADAGIGPMSDQQSYLEAIDAEMARLRERLEKLAKFKELATELGIAPDLGLAQQPKKDDPAPAPSAQPEPSQVADIPVKIEAKAGFNGTFADLIEAYRTHEKSPYHNLKHAVRQNYDQALNRLNREVGSEPVAEWNATRIKDIHDNNWAAGGKISMGQSMIAKLRLLASFGSVVLDSDACTKLSTIIGNMRFKPAPPRTEILTIDHARAIRAAATSLAWPSIALAQALQFEIPKLRQVDILGEWVPMSEPGPDDINNGTEKWVGGLLWSNIDEKMFLSRELSNGRMLNCDLKRLSMIMEEIHNVPPWKREGGGPMIICEYSAKPWTASEFRRKWRIVADKAGVPSNIQITDGARGTNKSLSSNKSAVDLPLESE